MKVRFFSLTLLLTLGLGCSVWAQGDDGKNYVYHTSGTIAQGAKQKATDVEDIGEIDEQGGSTALRNKFRFNVDFQTAYTTNALQRGNNSSSDVLFLPTVEAGFHTALDKHFNLDIDTRVESAIYSRFQDHGFIGYDALVTLDYHIREGLPRFYLSVEDYRYDTFDTGQLQTEAVGFIGGTDWGIAFNGGRTLGFVGYSFSDYLSDPKIDSRLVHRVVAGFAHQLTGNLTAQLYYVYQYGSFTDFDRTDNKHTVSGALIYNFNDHWSGTFTSSYINEGSTMFGASYQSFSTTLGLALHF